MPLSALAVMFMPLVAPVIDSNLASLPVLVAVVFRFTAPPTVIELTEVSRSKLL